MHSPSPQGPPPLGALLHMRYRDFYPSHPASVRHARHDFQAHVSISQLPDEVAYKAELCLSELATNAVRHANDTRPRPRFHVSCNVLGHYRHYLQIGVHDVDSHNIPELPATPLDPLAAFDEDQESGRGLYLVTQLADAVSIEHGPGCNGKTVWCRFDLPSPPTLMQRLVPRSRIPAYPVY